MSASPVARSISQVKNIPTRRMLITDINQLPSEYSSTPGGTLYSTTPGGTHIVYDRSFLMNLRNSPMSQTPPKSGTIPECLLKCSPPRPFANNNNNNDTKNITTITVTPEPESNSAIDEVDEQFAMEI